MARSTTSSGPRETCRVLQHGGTSRFHVPRSPHARPEPPGSSARSRWWIRQRPKSGRHTGLLGSGMRRLVLLACLTSAFVARRRGDERPPPPRSWSVTVSRVRTTVDHMIRDTHCENREVKTTRRYVGNLVELDRHVVRMLSNSTNTLNLRDVRGDHAIDREHQVEHDDLRDHRDERCASRRCPRFMDGRGRSRRFDPSQLDRHFRPTGWRPDPGTGAMRRRPRNGRGGCARSSPRCGRCTAPHRALPAQPDGGGRATG